ncbi:hypothetical protein GRX03_05630 [Halovenus sp. WSH3]|uniref:DUF7577 domain-containing protein n=1 Tax=Halovenus carboxidivorans TaxID=2692199 RepID=A0A6B0T1Q1_9EURY|nr:hypothetical protein [Halovenus carboxidivorans]MXR51087.1 hypothetical protein [Halovenus carboxidivorans]
MYGQLWLLIALAAGFVGLGLGLYVLRNILREAIERQTADEPTPAEPEREGHPEPERPAQDERAGRRTCPNCQTVNEPGFRYCSECASRL